LQITQEMLEKRQEELLHRREELLAQANACNGALEDLVYWLTVLANGLANGTEDQKVRLFGLAVSAAERLESTVEPAEKALATMPAAGSTIVSR
jgi:hypothetical protein